MKPTRANTHHSHSAWDAAAAYGIDMTQVAAHLKLTPSERVQLHSKALNTVMALRAAVGERHARS